MPGRTQSSGFSRVDKVARALGRPSEDLKKAMSAHATWQNGPDAGRIASLSVRVGGTRQWRYGHATSIDRVARALNVSPELLRGVMRDVAVTEGKEQGVWTMTTRVW